MAKRELSPTYSDYVKQLKLAFDCKAPILLWGTSHYLHHKAIVAIEKKRPRNVQMQSFSPQELRAETLQEQLGHHDMFGSSQWVVLRRAESDRNLHKKIKDLRIQQPNNLIISHPGTQPPKNLLKVLETAHLVPCFAPKPLELPQFVRALGNSLGIALTLEQAEALITITGEELEAIDNELQILALAYHDRQTQGSKPADIMSHIKKQRQESCFRITDFLVRGETPRALVCLETLLQQGEAPLAILGILAKHCRTTLSFQEGLLPQGYIPRTQQQLYKSYARNISKAQCRQALLDCASADRQLKSSTTPADIALSQIIWSLTPRSMIK